MATPLRPHAVIVPYPCSGNINPALQLAKLLHRHGAYVTFVNTEHNHRRMQQAAAAAAEKEGAVAGDGEDDTFRFETILDGLSDAERGSNDYGLSLCVATSQRCAAPLRELIVRLNATPGVPPVSCVVPTYLMSFVLDVAAELGIPSMLLWGCSAGALLGHMKLRDLRHQGYIPVKGTYQERELEAVIDWIPGLPSMRLGDFSGFLRRMDDPDSFGLRFNETEATNCTKAGAVLLNTFEGLEPDALAALRAELPRVFTVGPLGTLLAAGHGAAAEKKKDGGGPGQADEPDDAPCMSWLDAQAPGSVVYVSFGSHAVLTPAEVTELAWGLAAAGRPFLWSVRDDLVSRAGGATAASPTGAAAVLAVLPPEFFASSALSPTTCSFLITSWCAQERVLRHRAVGCFLTHGGWNSVCESLAAGVPMVCCPGFADQYTNSKLAADVWGVAARLDEGLGGGPVIRREKVAARVREVMLGKGINKRVATWKVTAEAAARPGGTSYDNIQSVVKAMTMN
ncbi:hypothetical protein EJB05_01090, partial [Eragrostis curvula]